MDELPVSTLVATLAFAGGLVLGATARAIQFCTLGAIADAFMTGNHIRLRGWILAAATALLGTQGLHMAGLIDLGQSFYLSPDFGWLGAILGGLAFGFGMALVGTCSYGTLIRLGGGDLRALIDFLVIGIFGYMTLRGLSGLGRVLLIEPTNADLSALGGQGLPDLLSVLLGAEAEALRPPIVGLVATALLAYCFGDATFRRRPREIVGGLIIGLVIVGGWAITGIAGADDFDPVPLASYSFVTPLGETLVYFMTFTGATIDFGIGAVGGVLAGAAATSLARRDWRLEAFDDGREMLRHLGGAALMGMGGVIALGCTIGQGVTGMSTLSISAPLALASIFLGAYFGLKVLVEGSLGAAIRSGFARY